MMCHVLKEFYMKNLSIAETIQKARLQRRLSQAKLAEIINVSHVTISCLERGTSVSEDVLKRAALALDLNLDHLLDTKTNTYYPPSHSKKKDMCKIIDTWFEDWKMTINQDKNSFLGAKETLKGLLCNPYLFDK